MGALVAIGAATALIAGFAYFWGREKGKAAEDKVIRGAFENAGIAKDRFDKVLAAPLDNSPGLFNDWVSKDGND